MNTVTNVNQALDILAAGATKTAKQPEININFKSLLNQALDSQTSNSGSKATEGQKQVQQTETITITDAAKKSTTEKTGKDDIEKVSTDTVEETVVTVDTNLVAAIATVTVPVTVPVVSIAVTEEITQTPVQDVNTLIPAGQATTGPIVPNTVLSPMQYAQRMAEITAPTPDEATATAPENQILIDSAEMVTPQTTTTPEQTAETPDITAVTPQVQAPDTETAVGQDRFDDLMAQATRALNDRGIIDNQARPIRQTPVPEELQAEVPEDVVERRDQPALIRAVERNITRANREADREFLPTPAQTTTTNIVAQPPVMPEPISPVEIQPLPTGQVFTPRPIEQIQAEIVRNLDRRNMEFRMQLTPQELGRINVKMVMESGRVTVEIVAFSDRTAELLSRNTEGLISTLRIANVDLQSVNVVVQPQNQNNHMEQALNQSNPGGGQQSGDNRQNRNQESMNNGGYQDFGEEEDAQRPNKLLDYEI